MFFSELVSSEYVYRLRGQYSHISIPQLLPRECGIVFLNQNSDIVILSRIQSPRGYK